MAGGVARRRACAETDGEGFSACALGCLLTLVVEIAQRTSGWGEDLVFRGFQLRPAGGDVLLLMTCATSIWSLGVLLSCPPVRGFFVRGHGGRGSLHF